MPSTSGPVAIEVRGRRLDFGSRTYVMGIVNATPDSFSGDGLVRPGADLVGVATHQAVQMVAEGADLLDIGGESTRPDHVPVGAEEELARVTAVVAALREALPDVPISIDTSKIAVATAALDAGADIINDVSAVTSGAQLAPLAAARAVPYIVMHSRSEPVYRDVVAEVISDLHTALDEALLAGCSRGSLIVDPGIGFGKTVAQNLVLLRELTALRELGRPILLGVSRKSTIGRVLDLPADQRLEGTLATTALGIAAGADIVRVHDVAANVRAARMSDAIVRDQWQDGAPDQT